ncbi:MAG: DUF1192 domain-containing protein [Kiloniellales bacterium]
MVDDDDLTPQHVKPKQVPKNLALMSLEALDDYIAELEAEIARAREAIAEKQSARGDAESVFRS